MHYWLRGWTPQSPLVYRNTLLKSKLISKFSKTLTKFRDGENRLQTPKTASWIYVHLLNIQTSASQLETKQGGEPFKCIETTRSHLCVNNTVEL